MVARTLVQLALILHVAAFTRPYRKIVYSYNIGTHIQTYIEFDPAVTSVKYTISDFCTSVYCDQTQETMQRYAELTWENVTARRIEEAISQYWRRFPDSSFLPYSTDALTQREYDVSLSAIYDAVINWTPANEIAAITTLQELFNKKEYHLTAALSNYVLLHASYDVQELTQILVLSSEVFRLVGELEAATSLSMQVVINYCRMANYGRSALHRLRILLSVPPVPLANSTNMQSRQEMEEDLLLFYHDIQRENIHISLQELQDDVAATNFHLSHQGLNDRNIQELLAKIMTTLCPELNYISPHITPGSRLSSSRLRIGFLSTYFFDHSIGKILVELILYMTTLHADIDIYVFQIANSIEDDVITTALRSILGKKYVLVSTDVLAARYVITDYLLDVAIYTDIGMDYVSYLLAFSRLAPIQIAWWGHPITTGIPTIDYFFGLTDEVASADQQYSEQLVRMEYVNTAPFHMIERGYDFNISSTQHFGVPDGAPFALIVGRLFKLHPSFDAILFDILKHSSGYVVVIAEAIHEWNDHIYQRWKEYAWRHKAHKLLQRIVFANYDYYVDALLRARVVLDTYPYGGCLTAHDAMSNGVPIVTLPSEYIRNVLNLRKGRFTLAMYRQMNYMELVAETPSHYVELATKLLHNATYWKEQAREVGHKFATEIHKNTMVAEEWLSFVRRLI